MGNWHWDLSSNEYGQETLGPYDTKKGAQAGIKRVKNKAKQLDDGVKREYGQPYQK
jgi:hypothetical protein